MSEASMSHREVFPSHHRIEFPDALTFNHLESGDVHAVQIIREVLRATTDKIMALQASQGANVERSMEDRTRKLTRIKLDDDDRLEKIVRSIDQDDREEIAALEDEGQVILEGIDAVARGRAPSETYFSILDQLEEKLAMEVSRADSVVALSDNAQSNKQLEVARARLATLADYKHRCLELLSEHVQSKRKN